MADLFDIVVRRQVYIEGLKAKKGNDWAIALGELQRLLQQRLALIEFDDLGQMSKKAIFLLIADLRKIALSVFNPMLNDLIEWLKRYVEVDYDMLAKLYIPRSPNPPPIDETPDRDKLWAAWINTPLEATGTLALPFLLALAPSIMVKLERLVMQHFAARAKTAVLRKAIVGTVEGKFNDSALRAFQRQAEAATNTVIQHLANQANQAQGAKSFGFYEWVSVLDNQTTDICIFRDGKRWPYGGGPVPPAHVGCRSTTVPVPANSPKTADQTFSEWIRNQPFEFIDDAFDGQRPSRYEKASAITLNDFLGKLDLIGQ
jgi:SPP1 gp7 family putative phage head morphogenesis protein